MIDAVEEYKKARVATVLVRALELSEKVDWQRRVNDFRLRTFLASKP